MENYKVTRREAHMIIYGLICAAVNEELTGHEEIHDEFISLADKLNTWLKEAEHASDT